MDTVKQWVLTVVIAAAAGAIVLMLSPDGSVNKSVKTAVSLFLIVAMIMPFAKGIDFDFRDIISESEAESPELNDAVLEQMRAALQAEIEKILDENGIKVEEINIDMNIKDNEIAVNSIYITADSGGNIGNAEKRIREETGAGVKIEVRE